MINTITFVQVGVEVTEELERNERNYMKEEQERAYQEAQLADQVSLFFFYSYKVKLAHSLIYLYLYPKLFQNKRIFASLAFSIYISHSVPFILWIVFVYNEQL